MRLPFSSLKKFAREALVTATPLKLKRAGVAELRQRLTAWFAANDELFMTWDPHPDYRYRLGIVRVSGEPYYFGGIALELHEQGLFIVQPYNADDTEMRPVGRIDELLTFLRLCGERAARIKGQAVRQKKVNKLRGVAVLARLRELARVHRFDFATAENKTTLELFLRFGGLHVVELRLPFSGIDELLPRLEESLPMLARLADAGLDAHVRPNHAKRSRTNWILHQALGEADPAAGE